MPVSAWGWAGTVTSYHSSTSPFPASSGTHDEPPGYVVLVCGGVPGGALDPVHHVLGQAHQG